jgi:uncharacterized membrane protein YidH (DUF202 family)
VSNRPEPSFPVDVRANDTLANERTFLAYVRTALSFIAFGFVIARFSLFTREFAELAHETLPEKSLSIVFGTVMALFGVFIAIVGAWRHAVTDRGLRRGVVLTLSARAGYLISLFVAAIGAVVALVLLSYR